MSNQQIIKEPLKSKKEEEVKDDDSIKGPPLGSSTHTMQFIILLTLNSILVFLCLFVLPLHLLWRQIVKQDLTLNADPATIIPTTKEPLPISQLAKDVFSISKQNNDPIGTNLIHSFHLMFSAPASDVTIQAWIRRGNRSTLAALVLLQSWFVARFKGWWDEAEAMERGDREEVMKRRRIGIGKQMENVTMTSFTSVPFFTLGLYVVLTLFGAPFFRNNLDTLFLSGFISVLALLPAIHVLGSNESEWFKAFSFSKHASHATQQAPRFQILIWTTPCTLAGALIGSAGFLLDWDKAWQVYPVPAVLGACIGSLIGNLLAGLAYFFSSPSRSAGPMVERKAKSIFSGPSSNSTPNTNKKKKKR